MAAARQGDVARDASQKKAANNTGSPSHKPASRRHAHSQPSFPPCRRRTKASGKSSEFRRRSARRRRRVSFFVFFFRTHSTKRSAPCRHLCVCLHVRASPTHLIMSAITYVGSDLSCAANLFTSVTVCRRGAHMRTEAESIDSALAATASSGCPKRCDRGSEISGNWKEFGCFAGQHVVASLSLRCFGRVSCVPTTCVGAPKTSDLNRLPFSAFRTVFNGKRTRFEHGDAFGSSRVKREMMYTLGSRTVAESFFFVYF